MTLRFFKWSSAVAYQEFKFDSIICYLSFWKKKICVTAVIMWKISLLWKFIFPVHDFALLMLQIFFFLFLQILSVSSSFFSTSKTNWWPLHYQNTNKYGNKYGKSNFQHFTLIFYLSFILIQSGNYRPYIPWL